MGKDYRWSQAEVEAYVARYQEAWSPEAHERKPALPAEGTTLPATTSEAVLMAMIRHRAKCTGWLTYHTYRSDKSPPGFPDLVLVKPGRLIFAEVKTATGKLTPYQQTWLDLLRHAVADVEVYVWRPHDFPAIIAILERSTP